MELAPAAIFGNSAGAIIGLDLVIRHPELVRAAILHEPPMIAAMSNPEEVMGAIQQVVESGLQRVAHEEDARLSSASSLATKLLRI